MVLCVTRERESLCVVCLSDRAGCSSGPLSGILVSFHKQQESRCTQGPTLLIFTRMRAPLAKNKIAPSAALIPHPISLCPLSANGAQPSGLRAQHKSHLITPSRDTNSNTSTQTWLLHRIGRSLTNTNATHQHTHQHKAGAILLSYTAPPTQLIGAARQARAPPKPLVIRL